uniref:Uncharacterized protein n=1 Tax=Kuenenia stuttgartiensis TaxID=174633 RepID=Q1Q6B3_KUEST|nr:unknown protein [Candidatus Kuenenia stuttgartiensis]
MLIIAETGFKPVSTICYNILFCYKQAAPTELIGSTFFKKLKCYIDLLITVMFNGDVSYYFI